jgi:anti-anti-sigma factor
MQIPNVYPLTATLNQIGEFAMAAQPISIIPETRHILCPRALVRGGEKDLFSQALPALDHGDVTLDMREVELIDAAGLGMLVILHHAAKQAGSRLAIANPRPRIHELLQLTRLDSILMDSARS